MSKKKNEKKELIVVIIITMKIIMVMIFEHLANNLFKMLINLLKKKSLDWKLKKIESSKLKI